MPRSRTPLAKARLTGADRNHPERFRGRSEPLLSGRGVGDPPSHLSKSAQAAWRAFVGELGWLVHEDRAALEAASIARAQVSEMAGRGEPVTGAALAAYRSLLASLGGTPTDRSRVVAPKGDEDPDPFAAFVQ